MVKNTLFFRKDTPREKLQRSLRSFTFTEQKPDYDKLMFIRLRKKHPNYGHASFYLGRVTCLDYQGEKPIKVRWRFEKNMPQPIYEYLTDPQFRKYRIKEEFIEEYKAYS